MLGFAWYHSLQNIGRCPTTLQNHQTSKGCLKWCWRAGPCRSVNYCMIMTMMKMMMMIDDWWLMDDRVAPFQCAAVEIAYAHAVAVAVIVGSVYIYIYIYIYIYAHPHATHPVAAAAAREPRRRCNLSSVREETRIKKMMTRSVLKFPKGNVSITKLISER